MGALARLVNAPLRVVGLQLQRTTPRSAGARPFYDPPGSCQIPELSTLYRLFLGERHAGLFVDVGAYDGLTFSNTSCLAAVGWSGLLVEPVPAFAQACRDRYRGNDRVRVVEAAVGASRSTIEIAVAGPLTTASRKLADAYAQVEWAKAELEQASMITVEQRTLDEILESEGVGRPIDVLSVDVEGVEAEVFAGLTLSRWTPRLVIAELVHTHPDLHELASGDAALQRSIERAGYSVVYKDAMNTVFVLDDCVEGAS